MNNLISYLIGFVIILFGVFGWASASHHHHHDFYGVGGRQTKIDEERQKDILKLFDYIYQPPIYPEHLDLAKSYSIEANIDAYLNSTSVNHFIHHYKAGHYLKRGEVFSIFYDEHLQQAIDLFHLFYDSRDFDTLYKTAVWSRTHLNEGVFVYAFSVAFVHRDDTYGHLFLPPIYEIFPNYFFGSDVIQKAQNYRQFWRTSGVVDPSSPSTYGILANYSGHYLNLPEEQRTFSYYYEDVGINAFYYYAHIFYPFWMDGERYKLKRDRRGEAFYYLYQQFLARYYLERLCAGHGDIAMFSYEDGHIADGFYPSLRYANGLDFASRPHHAQLSNYFYNYGQRWSFKGWYGYSYTLAQDAERRIRDAIDGGYAFTHDGKPVDLFRADGFEVLSNFLLYNADSINPRFYGHLEKYARHLLAYGPQPLSVHHVVPAALEHYETAHRDPAFYALYKRITVLFQRYKSFLPPYTFSELQAPGVEIKKFTVDKLVTYFDSFDVDLSNAIYYDEVEAAQANHPTYIYARQQRLNHKPFSYRIEAHAEQPGDYVVRVYFGPKHDQFGHVIALEENRVNFVEFETFRFHLNAGTNQIERSSRQFQWYVPDRTGRHETWMRFNGTAEPHRFDASEMSYGYPNRLLLPKGTRSGYAYQFFAMISPYSAPSAHTKTSGAGVVAGHGVYKVGSGFNYVDNYPFGYPFDRKIHTHEFYVPNAIFHDVYVYHKSGDELNSSNFVDDDHP